jgi:glycosyltransferase involved in cell wall biosynthesis
VETNSRSNQLKFPRSLADGDTLKILICEPEPAGHRFRYVQSIAERALQRGHFPILATTAKAHHHTAFKELRASIPETAMPAVEMRDPLVSFLPRFSRWQQLHLQWRSWLCFRACYRRLPAEHRPDFALIPYFDALELAVAALGSPFGLTPWGGILMQNRFHQATVNRFTPPAPMQGLRRSAFERNLSSSTLGALVTIDETLTEFYRARGLPQLRLRFAGEPAEVSFTIPKEEARRRLNLPADGCYILLYGNVHMRKGLAELITGVSALPVELGARLLIFGPQDSMERQYIASHGTHLRETGRLFEFDRFASIEDESLAFSATDIVWAGYSRHYGPSSVQGKACSAGCAVIACREGNLGWTTSRYKLGVTVDVHDAEAVNRALLELVRGGPAAWSLYKEAGLSYTSGRSSQDFGDAIVRMIEESVTAVDVRAIPLTLSTPR